MVQRKQTKELKEWKEKVKDRDGRKCVICGNTEYLNAHHVIPFAKANERTNHLVHNGISLCPLHHKWGNISAHKNGLWFFKWMWTHRKAQIKLLWDYVEV